MFSDQKKAIAAAFGRACRHYDEFAHFQRSVGHALMDNMQSVHACRGSVLDVGSGTGYFSGKWQHHNDVITGVDLSLDMVNFAKTSCPEARFLQGDAEHLPFADNTFDVVFSNLALQWCEDLSVPLKEMQRVLKPNGVLGFTTLLSGSLSELASVSQDGETVRVNHFLSKTQFLLTVDEIGQGKMIANTVPWSLEVPNARTLMKELKGIGANHLCQGRSDGLMGKGKWQAIECGYERLRLPNGQLPVTYQVGFGVMING
jgi:malonyl-CoA O-methyltransferase